MKICIFIFSKEHLPPSPDIFVILYYVSISHEHRMEMLREHKLRKYQNRKQFRVFYLLFIRWWWHIMHWCGNWSFLDFHHRQRCLRLWEGGDGVIHRCTFTGRGLGSFSCLITQLEAFQKTDSLEYFVARAFELVAEQFAIFFCMECDMRAI